MGVAVDSLELPQSPPERLGFVLEIFEKSYLDLY
jgi:hypothetical protein